MKQTFGSKWAHMLSLVMDKSGKGYRQYSLKRTGSDERRRDKSGDSTARRYKQRYT